MTSTDWLPHQVISGDATQLSDHDPFDLKGPRSGTSIGRIKIAPAKGTPLVERVEFSNDWLLADLHGVQHDYYQGEGTIDLKVEWRKETGGVESIMIRVTPWLAYACSVGCRMQLRKPGEAEGRTCTVQRVLPDDRCVVRVDGLSGTDPKKAVGSAEDVVDASPSTCVPTSNRRYPAGARLLVLHEAACSDAVVEDWVGPIGVLSTALGPIPRNCPSMHVLTTAPRPGWTDPKEGSRHRLWLAQGGAVFGWVTCKTTSNINNLIPSGMELPETLPSELNPLSPTEVTVPAIQAEIEFTVGSLMQVRAPTGHA
jgi:hypothetical protein